MPGGVICSGRLVTVLIVLLLTEHKEGLASGVVVLEGLADLT